VVLLMPASFVARIMAGRGFGGGGMGTGTGEVTHLKVKSNILEKLFDEPEQSEWRMASRGQVCSGSVQLGSERFGSVSCHSLADPNEDDI